MQSIFSEESQAISQRSRRVLNIMQVFAGKTPRFPSQRRMQPSMNVQRAKLLPDLRTLLEHDEKQIYPIVPECLNASGLSLWLTTTSPITFMPISAPSSTVPLSLVSRLGRSFSINPRFAFRPRSIQKR
ncbi:hypothetical protein [Bradyrhizobium sp. CCBAU 51765]|uniref:hypothetical protein n=1 Tax=Bradyrhizobium sp. CCBAU 51765 TaxID=1325102 RepID=UPI001888164D|nr:hypothetical protein [Bradyrhizobium sp. CCBAU 51765]